MIAIKQYGEENARKAHIGPLTHNREKVSYEDDYTTDIFSEKVVDIIKSFFSDGRNSWVVRHGRWKLAHNLEWKHRSFMIENERAVRDSPYVYPGGFRLYDLKKDIAEQNDLSGLYPEIVDSLQQMYQGWRDKMEYPASPSWSDEPIIPEDEEFPSANKEYEVDVWSDGSHQNHYPRLAVDENPDTWWQTQSGNIAMPYPHQLVVDNKKPSLIKGISYLSAPGQGRVKDFEVYVSNSRDSWGNPVHKGQLKNNDKEQEIQFTQNEKGRYLKFKVLSSYSNDMVARVSELKIITN